MTRMTSADWGLTMCQTLWVTPWEKCHYCHLTPWMRGDRGRRPVAAASQPLLSKLLSGWVLCLPSISVLAAHSDIQWQLLWSAAAVCMRVNGICPVGPFSLVGGRLRITVKYENKMGRRDVSWQPHLAYTVSSVCVTVSLQPMGNVGPLFPSVQILWKDLDGLPDSMPWQILVANWDHLSLVA